MFENVLKNAAKDLKKAFKEEVFDKIDDFVPVVIGVASVALMIVAKVPATKAAVPQVVNIFIKK